MKKIIWAVAFVVLVLLVGFSYQVAKYSGMKKECMEILSSNPSARTISIYFKSATTDQNAQVFSEKIRSIEGIKNVVYISSSQALEVFKEKNKDSPTILQSLKELKINPLLASVSVEFERMADAADTGKEVFFKNLAMASGVSIERIIYSDTEAKLVERINNISSFVGITSFWNDEDSVMKNLLSQCVKFSAK